MNHHCSRKERTDCGYEQIPVLKEMVRSSDLLPKWEVGLGPKADRQYVSDESILQVFPSGGSIVCW